MKKNNITEIINEGKVVINGWLSIPNSFASELMASVEWDSITLDLQHGLIDYSSSISMLQSINNSTKPSLARVPWNEPGIIMKMLDLGVSGIICPMINNQKECEKFVSYCKYPPIGERSFGPMRAQINFGTEYYENANKEILSIAMIESKEAFKNLDKILSTKGLNGIYVGPADLSFSYNDQPGFDIEDSPIFEKIELIAKKANENNIFAGIHVGSYKYTLKAIDLGYQFISILNESKFMLDGVEEILKKIKGQNKKNNKSIY